MSASSSNDCGCERVFEAREHRKSTGLRAFVARTVCAVRIVGGDGRIPRPLRWGGAVGLAPVPGPFDEAVLLVVGGILWLLYRDQIREAWDQSLPPKR